MKRNNKKRIILGLLVVWCMGCSDSLPNTSEPDLGLIDVVDSGLQEKPSVCDGSDDLVLAMRRDSFHRLATHQGFFGENGLEYIYLNGKCQFWTWLPTAHPNTQSVLTGTLDKDEEYAFLKMIHYDAWKELDDTFYLGSDNGGGDFSMSTRSIFFRFTLLRIEDTLDTPEGTQRKLVLDGFPEALAWLRDRGSPVDQGRLRVLLEFRGEINESWWDNLSPPAYTELWATQWGSIQEIEKEQQPYCFGDSFLLQGDDAEAMWALRERYREEAKKYNRFRLAVRDENGFRHALYIRDVLPFENEIGLVALNTSFDQASCF